MRRWPTRWWWKRFCNPTVPLNFWCSPRCTSPGDSLPTGNLVLKLKPVVRLLKR